MVTVTGAAAGTAVSLWKGDPSQRPPGSEQTGRSKMKATIEKQAKKEEPSEAKARRIG
jgi:hypothetical protein